MTRRDDLVALVGSRICHDLISPLGAIGNGVELLEMGGMSDSPEMELISESVTNANARVKFFRMAFGTSSDDATVGRGEITQILASSARGGRISYFWAVEGPQLRREVRAVFLTLMCYETAMPHGGDIHIRRHDDTWELTSEADRIRIDDDLWGSLTDRTGSVSVTPSQVQFALLPQALDDIGRRLTLKTAPDRLVVRF